MYFRKWPREWYLLPTVKPAYNRVAILWVIFLGVKGGLQVLFFDNPEVLAVIKLATSNQTTLILLVVSYFIGLNKLKALHGPSVEEFKNNTGRFMSEYGMQSFPDLKTIEAFAEQIDLLEIKHPLTCQI